MIMKCVRMVAGLRIDNQWMMDRPGRVALEVTTNGDVSLNSPLWRKWTLIRRNYVEKRNMRDSVWR